MVWFQPILNEYRRNDNTHYVISIDMNPSCSNQATIIKESDSLRTRLACKPVYALFNNRQVLVSNLSYFRSKTDCKTSENRIVHIQNHFNKKKKLELFKSK